MTDIRTAQRAYDNAEPDSTYTMAFHATIGQADAEVMAFAEVWEQSGEVHCINEVVYCGVDISAALTSEQNDELMEQAETHIRNRDLEDYIGEMEND
jgi:hypothetical protein